MKNVLSYIKTNMPCDKISVNSQTQAVGFYEKFGFEQVGEEFMEEGVPHIKMLLGLEFSDKN
jgi:ElaA protein